MITLGANQVAKALDYKKLINHLNDGFKEEFGIPKRHHHDYPNPPGKDDSSLLLMPAWKEGENVGVKIVNVTPQNSQRNIPSIHGVYLYFDGKTGIPLALMDSNTITKKRTAATSALASRFLSKDDCRNLLMVGTGVLAPELIKAHCTERDIKKVKIWGRNISKAEKVKMDLEGTGLDISVIEDIESGVRSSDLISVATLSKEPLIEGEWLDEGTHVDLVGSYRPDMREADDEVLLRSSLFIDTYQGAPYETGDLVIPLESGIISMPDIKADMFELCRGQKPGRKSNEEITVFKSVGHALEDLVAAQLVYDVYRGRTKDE